MQQGRIWIGWALVTLLVAGCGSGATPETPARGGGQTVPVTAEAVGVGPWQERIEALGTARANESLTLTAKVTETVVRVNFEDGDLVQAGQLLVDLSGRAEVAALEEAQAAYTAALQQYQRQAELVKQGTLSKSVLDSLVATRDAAQARREAIRARLADRIISAPFAGLLGFRRVSPGTLVTPGTPITTLDDISSIKLDFAVPEAYLSVVSVGQAVAARSVSWPDRVFEGTVTAIDSRVDAATRSVTVRALLPNDESLLRPGMLLTVEVLLASEQILSIPEISLVQVGSRRWVYRIGADSSVEQVEVDAGRRQGGRVEIRSGLTPGDRIVVDGVGKMRAGARVNVVERDREA